MFRVLADTAGANAPRWPDGETGERSYWIRWQKKTFEDHPDFVLKSTRESLDGYKDNLERPFFVLRGGVAAADVTTRLWATPPRP